MVSETPRLRATAEERYADELARLAAADDAPRPPGWCLSARAVRRFIFGDPKLGVTRKFYGDDPLVDRAIVSLMSNQGLMLVGEPGTAKSMLSELLAAAVSGDSGLVVQGSARTAPCAPPPASISSARPTCAIAACTRCRVRSNAASTSRRCIPSLTRH